MSDKERPRDYDGGGGDEEEEGEGPTKKGDSKGKKCEGCKKKGKRLSFFRVGKGKKVRKEKGIYVNLGCWGRRAVSGGGVGGCLRKPRTLDSSGESPTSDPNSSEFTFDMLRALIEKNDFYSKECNPHFDLDESD